MKQHCAESVVFDQTSEVGRRIWRMLLLQGKMEQRQVLLRVLGNKRRVLVIAYCWFHAD